MFFTMNILKNAPSFIDFKPSNQLITKRNARPDRNLGFRRKLAPLATTNHVVARKMIAIEISLGYILPANTIHRSLGTKQELSAV